MLRVWSTLAALVLALSILIHIATFSIDPLARLPHLLFFTFAIIPPFLAALYYASTLPGPTSARADAAMMRAPLPLRILAIALFAYTLVNGALHAVASEGGVPEKRGDIYVLHSHNTILRHLTEAEFHQHQAYAIRGFSSVWMLFSAGSLTLLIGAARARNSAPIEPPPSAPAPPPDPPAPELPPQPTTLSAGLTALVFYLLCLLMIGSGKPFLSLITTIPVIAAAVLAIQRRRGFPHAAFESIIGCLAVFPNALIASFMGRRVAEFIYLAIAVSPSAALTHSVAITFPDAGPSQLTSGALLDNRLWAALMLFIQFPLFAVGTLGLTYLAEHVGRLLEVRHPRPYDTATPPIPHAP